MRFLILVALLGGPAAAAPAAAVRIEMRTLPWWTVANDGDRYVLMFSAPETPATPGRALGKLRSAPVPLDQAALGDVLCAWQIVPFGEPRPCPGPRVDAMTAAHVPITQALDDLRARAAPLGASIVDEVECYADASSATVSCEGRAIDPTAPPRGEEVDPAAPTTRAPQLPVQRLVIGGDGSVSVVGGHEVTGAALFLRYRPLEVAFDVLSFHDDAGNAAAAIGGTLLGRHRLASSGVNVVAGTSLEAAFINHATNPTFSGLTQAFAGIGYQTRAHLGGAAQPFIQLRAGVSRGGTLSDGITPFVSIHLGLTTPER